MLSWLAAPLAVALICLLVFLHAPVSHAGGDSLWVLHTAASMAATGDLDLSEYSILIDGYPISPPHLLDIDGRRLNFYPWGASLIAVPFLGLAYGWSRINGGNIGGDLQTTLPLFELEQQIASLIAATSVFLLVALVRRRLTGIRYQTPLAMLIGLTFGLGSGMVSTISRNMWIQGPAILLIILLLWFLDRLQSARATIDWRDHARTAVCALLFVLAYATRPNLALLIIVVAPIVWLRGRWILSATFACVSGCALVIYGLVNRASYGSWQHPYSSMGLDLSSETLVALAANLVSPARGLGIWLPIGLMILMIALFIWRRLDALERLIGVWIMTHYLLIGIWGMWWGGASVGPRLLFDLLPGFALLAVPIVRWISEVSRSEARRALIAVAVLAIIWGGFVNLRAAYRMSVVMWNFPTPTAPGVDEDPRRVWDWRDPQFLR